MPDRYINTTYQNDRPVSFLTQIKNILSSPANWSPGVLLVIIAIWVFLAEVTDMLFLHHIAFTSSLLEGVVDSLVLLTFISPTYFLLYLPLRTHWQKELAAQEEIKLLSRKLLMASEDERLHLALELHDHFGQVVTSLQGKVEKIQRQLDPSNQSALQECSSLSDTVYQLGQDIREFTTTLRPDMLDDLGLVETLKWYIDDLAKQQPSLTFEYHAVGVKQRLPADTEIALYRVCQESLNNIIKHANASHVSVTLTYSHPLIILAIRDDGEGLPDITELKRDRTSHGFGLLGMRERLAAVGGTLELSSKRGERTIVRALVPIKEVAA